MKQAEEECTYEEVLKDRTRQRAKKLRVLCLNGSGIRAISSAIFIRELETKLNKKVLYYSGSVDVLIFLYCSFRCLICSM
jgi:hypothetical protein